MIKNLVRGMLFHREKLSLSRVMFAFSVVSPSLLVTYLSVRAGQMLDIPPGWIQMAGVTAAAFGVSKGISTGLDKTPPTDAAPAPGKAD